MSSSTNDKKLKLYIKKLEIRHEIYTFIENRLEIWIFLENRLKIHGNSKLKNRLENVKFFVNGTYMNSI